jgi:hypothetical protein
LEFLTTLSIQFAFSLDSAQNYGVQRIFAIILIFAYSVGVSQASPLFSVGGATKVKITHAHEGADHHHHHHDEPSENPNEAEHSDSHDSSGVPHSHEIYLASNFFHLSIQSNVVIGVAIQADIFPETFDISPPRGPSLDSIFRPPIA